MAENKTSNNSKRTNSTRTKKKFLFSQLKEKENHFLLDCINEQKSRLKTYDSGSDKFLHYFVVRVHPKCKKHAFTITKKKDATLKNIVSHDKLQEVLNQEKQKVMMTCQNKFEEPSSNIKSSDLKNHRSLKNLHELTEDDLIKKIQNSISYKKSENHTKRDLEVKPDCN